MEEIKTTVSRETIGENVGHVLTSISDRVVVDSSSINERTTKKGNVALQKKYNFVTKLGNRTGMTVTDSGLIESIEKIFVAERARGIMGYVICKEMANIADSGKIEAMGFKNIAEFGRAMFNYKTSTSNHYARIGRYFLDNDYHVKEGLPELSISHFIELNAFVGEDGDISDIVDMYLEGTLVDGMSTKELRNALSRKKHMLIDSGDSSGSSDSDDSGDSSDSSDSSTSRKKSNKQADSDSKSFDANVELGKALQALTDFVGCMDNLDKHGIVIDGFEEHLSAIIDLVKAAIQ